MKRKFSQFFGAFSHCRAYDIPIWQCPSFLFTAMGAINLASCLFFYFIGGTYIKKPEIIALITLGIASLLFIIAFAVSRSLERLAEVNRNKTEFIKIVSHQLRAPLTNIRWSIEFLMSRRKDKLSVEKENEYFGLIKENSERLENLLSDLLIVDRLRDESFFRYKDTVNFIDIIKEVIKDYQFLSKASNIEIVTKIIDQTVNVYGNKLLLEIALEKIFKNAIIFNKSGGKTEISLTRYPRYITVAVKDEGPGIPKSDRKYIFQRFFRGPKAFHTQTQGTGLGLYIARAIILKHGGTIWYRTKEGQGTVFYFSLPTIK